MPSCTVNLGEERRRGESTGKENENYRLRAPHGAVGEHHQGVPAQWFLSRHLMSGSKAGISSVVSKETSQA